jgi:transposase-like protein
MDLIQLNEVVPDELTAIKFFEYLRWGKKIRCGYCRSVKLSPRNEKDHRHVCQKCKKTTAVTIGTFFHGTRLPLRTWLIALAIITDAKKGLSAKQLERHLGVHYETAFRMYHKIRVIMSEENKSMDRLDGIVEMDETYIGGKPRKARRNSDPVGDIAEYDKRIKSLKRRGFIFKEGEYKKPYKKDRPKRGRGTSKIPVVGIVERDGNVVAEVMKYTTYSNLKTMVEKYVNEDHSVLLTDAYKGYNKMHNIIEHIKIDHHKMFSYKGINTNSIESFWAIIERGIMGQYHKVSLKYLPKYVAEFVYKYNNRHDTEYMFYELCRKAIRGK